MHYKPVVRSSALNGAVVDVINLLLPYLWVCCLKEYSAIANVKASTLQTLYLRCSIWCRYLPYAPVVNLRITSLTLVFMLCQTDWFPFIYCLETLDRRTAAKNWKSCVHPSRLDLEPLIECSATPLGAKVTGLHISLVIVFGELSQLAEEDILLCFIWF